ncbi:TPA: isoprenoid biosynthesis glyoxalase ElbB [Serratia rubidaea]
MKQVGVVLSGCGVYDGTEIHEAVLTLLALDRAGAQAVCFAPDKPQLHVINHLSGDEAGEQRNVLTESARIARGQVQPLSAARAEQLDALIVPGGFGAAKNLSSFATQGAECEVDDDLARLTREMHKANKPIGFMCIAPALLPKLLDQQVRLTIGNDPDLGEVIDTMGGEPVICPVDDIVVDGEHKVVTTPAYMLAQSIGEAASGIDKLVSRVLDLTE